MVFKHIGGTCESHVCAIFDLRLVLPRIVQMAQRRIRFHASDAVGHKAHVQLKLAQGTFGIGAKRAAYAAACKTERTESRLQLLDVFARKNTACANTADVRPAQSPRRLRLPYELLEES